MQGVRGRASTRTSAAGADAKSVAGRASARNSARGASTPSARSAGGRASASTNAAGADERSRALVLMPNVQSPQVPSFIDDGSAAVGPDDIV